MRLVKYRGYWCEYDPVTRKRQSLRTYDRVKAERVFHEREVERRKKKETVGEIVTAYLTEKKALSSHPKMEDAWRAAKATFDRLRPHQVTPEACRAYIKTRTAVSNGTIRKELGVIRQALRWHGYEPDMAFPSEPPPKERYLKRDEYLLLLAQCTAPHLKLFVQIALGTGARKGAILDLTWDRVDLERGIITLSKGAETNKRRATVPINETLKTALQESKKGNISGYVIEHRGKPVKDVDTAFRKACDRASGAKIRTTKAKGWRAEGGNKAFDDVTPHTLRHTAAVWLAEAGIPMSEIAQFLGHSNMTTTYKVYARYSPDYLRKAATVLEV